MNDITTAPASTVSGATLVPKKTPDEIVEIKRAAQAALGGFVVGEDKDGAPVTLAALVNVDSYLRNADYSEAGIRYSKENEEPYELRLGSTLRLGQDAFSTSATSYRRTISSTYNRIMYSMNEYVNALVDAKSTNDKRSAARKQVMDNIRLWSDAIDHTSCERSIQRSFVAPNNTQDPEPDQVIARFTTHIPTDAAKFEAAKALGAKAPAVMAAIDGVLRERGLQPAATQRLPGG